MATKNQNQGAIEAIGSRSPGKVALPQPVSPASAASGVVSLPSPKGRGSDTVEISAQARQAAAKSQGAPPAQAAPPPLKAPVGNADDVKFNYDATTHTMQTQVVDPKTGKTVAEIPSDDEIKARQRIHEILNKRGGSQGGQAASGVHAA